MVVRRNRSEYVRESEFWRDIGEFLGIKKHLYHHQDKHPVEIHGVFGNYSERDQNQKESPMQMM